MLELVLFLTGLALAGLFRFQPCQTPCGETGTGKCTECPDGMRETWEFTMSGITDDGCTDCDPNYNGTQTVHHSGAVTGQEKCHWNTTETAECRGTFSDVPRYRLVYAGIPDVWRIQAFGSESGDFGSALAIATWEIEGVLWDCTGNNTLTLTGTRGSDCANWPTDVVISPDTTSALI